MKNLIIRTLITLGFSIMLCVAITQCSHYKEANTQNIHALTDTISYYKSKTNDLVATKLLLQTEYDNLKIVNKELYDKIEAMKVSKPDNVVRVETIVERVKHDTIIIIKDSKANFDFSDEYRTLTGTIRTKSDSLEMSIDKDEVYLDYTLATKDDRVYVTSSNPYVKVTNIEGIVIPKKKDKWVIGPTVSVGYDFSSNRFAPMIGIGITYNIKNN